jgi:hypothetical protein
LYISHETPRPGKAPLHLPHPYYSFHFLQTSLKLHLHFFKTWLHI